MEQLYFQLAGLCVKTNEIIAFIRQQNYDAFFRSLKEFTEAYQEFLNTLSQNAGAFETAGSSLDMRTFVQVTGRMMQAQEEQDYVLFADYLELQLLPLFQSVLDALRQAAWDGGEEETERLRCFSQNVEQLRQAAAGTGKGAEACGRLLEAVENGDIGRTGVGACTVEPVGQGFLTVRVKGGGRELYMHSNSAPWKEADIFAEVYGDDAAQEYALFGLGLGYHAYKLWRRTLGATPVHVYETRPDVIYTALTYMNFTGCIGENFYIHYDKKLTLMSEKMRSPGVKPVIHYPSLQVMEEGPVKQALMSFFIQESSQRWQSRLLYSNFMNNQECGARPAEELTELFRGREVFFAAAGPSLDKNVELLKKRPGNSLLVAAGTVYRKLLKLGIMPDFVIVTDANERVIWQLRGLDQPQIGLIFLATANYRFAREHTGKKYIFYQKDFPESERFAKENGRQLFETGGSVATAALDLCIRFGAGRIVCAGLDLAFTDNLAHASDTSGRAAADPEALIPVRAYDGGTVKADNKFIMYREWIEERLTRPDCKDIRIINATEGGSYIKGMEHIPLRRVLEGD